MNNHLLYEKIKLLLDEKRKYGLEQKISFFEKRKLKKNMPIQKIMKYVEMANVTINVSKNVLIPRYETEELILEAIKIIRKNNYKTILDLCCGSGFIGIAIKKELKANVQVVQSDISKSAIKQTKKNCKINDTKNQIIHSDMFKKIHSKFDLIVSNPPYLLESQFSQMSNSVLEFEPHLALFAKNNGLEFYEIIEENLDIYLNPSGMIILEINPLNVEWFIQNNYTIINDINQKPRFALKRYLGQKNKK